MSDISIIWAGIEKNIKFYCRVKFDQRADQEDALAGGRELFLLYHRPAGQELGQLIRFGQLCCLRAARDQRIGPWRRESLVEDLEVLVEDLPVPANDLLDRLPLGLDATCRAAVDLLLQGYTQRETALELGLSVTALRRRLMSLAGRA